jgi:cytoplasmic iron level regulating protein YaaA (DUF328/UPF0246 family)
MLILLPPSETKAFPPAESAPVDLGALALPELTPVRDRLLKALVKQASGRESTALAALGLSQRQADEIARNRAVRDAPAAPAAALYTGVLYDALHLPDLAAHDQVLIFSGLWGVLRPDDAIPHYRCSAGVKLGRIGSVSAAWRAALRRPLTAHASDRLVIDLRSGAYAGLWTPGPNSVTIRVLHERDGKRSVVSHFNKATKGRLARALLQSGQQPSKPQELADLLRDMGHTVEGTPPALDIVVTEL